MHYRFIRDSFWGRIVYHLSQHRYFAHKEEHPDYVVPDKYLEGAKQLPKENDNDKEGSPELALSDSSASTLAVDQLIVVTWDGEDDPENPQNWPFYQKAFFTFEIAFLTVSIYIGSAIYTPGVEQIMEKFQVGLTVATLPLTLFVFGYGIGPMVFSPMSENAIFGRTSIYLVTLFVFFILQIPTALANDIASLSVLRFLGGFFASPALATGGASVGDILNFPYLPVGISIWSLAAVCGPSFGPLVGSVLTVKGGWRWTFWFMVIISGACFLFLGFFFPETYAKTLLYRKAKRLRALTGNQNITSEGEIENAKLTAGELAVETLWRPIELIIFEPVVLLINVYIGLVYSIMYLWFEAYPILFLEVHNFTLVEMGLTYISTMVGVGLGAIIYIPLIKRRFTYPLLAGKEVVPEVFLPITIVAGVLMPVGLLIFGWTGSPLVHWIAPLVGSTIFAMGAFFAFQTLFNYMGMSFPRYLASAFAGNDLFRSIMAGAFPLFGKPLFSNLATKKFPVAWGSMILMFLSLAMISIPVLFYLNGKKLRARSKYSN